MFRPTQHDGDQQGAHGVKFFPQLDYSWTTSAPRVRIAERIIYRNRFEPSLERHHFDGALVETAETLDGKWKPALRYVCPTMVPRAATNDYIDRIVTPARKYGFW